MLCEASGCLPPGAAVGTARFRGWPGRRPGRGSDRHRGRRPAAAFGSHCSHYPAARDLAKARSRRITRIRGCQRHPRPAERACEAPASGMPLLEHSPGCHLKLIRLRVDLPPRPMRPQSRLSLWSRGGSRLRVAAPKRSRCRGGTRTGRCCGTAGASAGYRALVRRAWAPSRWARIASSAPAASRRRSASRMAACSRSASIGVPARGQSR